MERVVAVAFTAATWWAWPHTSLEAQGPPPGVGQAVVLEGELDVLYEDGTGGGRLL